MCNSNILYDHTVICHKNKICWINCISNNLKIIKDLGNENFQVNFLSKWSRKDIEEGIGCLSR